MGACCSLPKTNRPSTSYSAYERSQPTSSGAYYESQPTTDSPSLSTAKKRPAVATSSSSSQKMTTPTEQQQLEQLDSKSGSPSLPASYPPQWQSPYETYFPPPVGSTAINSLKQSS